MSSHPILQTEPNIPDVRTEDFTYELPAEKIALHPLESREESRCLVASRIPFGIHDRHFKDLPALLPQGSLLVVNDSRVLPARIPCTKSSGGAAEVLLLESVRPTPNPALALESGSPGRWRALVGGKKIHAGDRLAAGAPGAGLKIEILEKEGAEALVELTWEPAGRSLAEVLEAVGKLPLPPYLKRELVAADASRYQTVYARSSGSVAAPTAGLHLGDRLRQELRIKGIHEARVTLHVGAGTFKPVDAPHARGHAMHAERFEVTLEFLESLARALEPRPARPPVVAVGTTSLRVLESLYWLGRRVLANPESDLALVGQWEGYVPEAGEPVFGHSAIEALVSRLRSQGLTKLVARTQIMIVPGYRFRTADWLITNFHQPHSSLILLVAAWMGPQWRGVYHHALANGYRFLSYGDGSLLMRDRAIPCPT